MNCPKCDQKMEHEDYDPDTGIMAGGYFCENCDVFIHDSEAGDDLDSYEPGL